MSAPSIWIPSSTPAELRRLLPDGIDRREYPAHGAIDDAPQPADIFIAGFDASRTIELIPQFDPLRVVQTLSAGVDAIVDHIPPGVTLCDGAGVHDASVAEWALMAMLAMRRNLPQHVRAQEHASWEWSTGGDDLDGAHVLIVGHGSIGRALEARLVACGARVTGVARRAREGVHATDELPRLLPEADIVVILVPLTPDTRGMVDARFLASMRDGALLVNAARGAVVDTGALLDALQREHIQAALDVTDPEPLPDGHPLWTAPGVLITPHVAGAVQRVMERGWRLAAEQVRRYVAGEPLRNVVSAGY